MATAPVKSQPLHNFSLPFLKWGQKNQMNTNHRCRKPSDLTRDSPPMATDHHRASPSEHDSDGGSKNESESENLKLPVGSRTVPNRFSFSSCSTLKHQAAVLEKESNDVCVERQRVCDDVEVEESAAKPWNLRPRKAVSEVAIEIGVVSRKVEFLERSRAVAAIAAVQRTENLPKSLRLRGFAEGQGSEKKEKRKFWISLSREEIEEDVYAMSGAKPARRPKRRPKNVQKQLDVLQRMLIEFMMLRYLELSYSIMYLAEVERLQATVIHGILSRFEELRPATLKPQLEASRLCLGAELMRLISLQTRNQFKKH